jgi:uncharacterized protein (UPF0335 family)
MSNTVDSDSVAPDQLRAFIERIERMESEKADIAADIREIYAEAKGNGFDNKVIRTIIRIRKMDHAERMEQEALLALYMSALGMQAALREDDDDDYTPPPRGNRGNDHRPAALNMGGAASVKSQVKASTGNADHTSAQAESGDSHAAASVGSGEVSKPSRGGGTPASNSDGVGNTAAIDQESQADVLQSDDRAPSFAGVEGDANRHPVTSSPPEHTPPAKTSSAGDEGDSSPATIDLMTGHTPTWPLTPADDRQVDTIPPTTDKPGIAQTAIPAPVASFGRSGLNGDSRCLHKRFCGEFSNFAFCKHGCRQAFAALKEGREVAHA